MAELPSYEEFSDDIEEDYKKRKISMDLNHSYDSEDSSEGD
jgi:hypothetical protein